MSISSSNMFVDRTAGALEHCDVMAKLYPDLAETYHKIRQLVTDKLWHQLTLTVLNLFTTSTPRTTAEGTNSFLALYDKVIISSVVESKLNQVSLARIATLVAESLTPQDGTAAKAILENLLQKQELPVEAKLYAESKLALLKLKLLDGTSREEMEEIKTLLKTNEGVLQEIVVEVEDTALVHSAHYECAMTYRKTVGPPEAFYKEALAFLNYTQLESLAPEVQHELAMDVSLAALTGEGVFNFGEVVTTPILQCLQNTSEQWLVDLLITAEAGHVVEFEAILQKHATEIQNQPALVNRAAFVKEKITLLALVNFVFQKASSERLLKFDEIAQHIHSPEVELVVMRAQSLGLIEGWMDQVDQTVQVTWVMPRVLKTQQLQEMATRFGEWAVKVDQTKSYMEQQQTPVVS